MLGFSYRQRYFLYPVATDMRKSFDGLSGLVNGQMGGELMSGDVFIFINRRRDRIKLLCWEGDGFVIWYKRLEAGTFELPAVSKEPKADSMAIGVNWEDLVLSPIIRSVPLMIIKSVPLQI